MAGDDNSNRTQFPSNHSPDRSQKPAQWQDDENPFVAFRRFADEQISSMLQSVVGIPSMTSHPQTDGWSVFTGPDNDNNTTRHREAEPSGGSGAGSSDDAHNSAPYNDHEKQPSISKQSQSEWSDPWHWHHRRRRDDHAANFFGFGSFFDRFWLDDHLPLSSRIFPPSTHNSIFGILEGDEDMPMWPVVYVMTSPYSPLQLEREARYRAHRGHDQGVISSLMSSLKLSSDPDEPYERDPAEPEWRDAFEDLLRIKYGKPMLDRESVPVRRQQPEKDWLAGLVQRGSLGDGWKYVPSQSGGWFTNRHKTSSSLPEQTGDSEQDLKDQKTETDPATELDMYERFLQDIEAREHEFSRQFQNSPIMRFLGEERQRHKEEIAAYRSKLAEMENRNENSDNWIDLVSGGKKNTVPDTVEKASPDSSAAVEQPPSTDVSSTQPHVTSTKTTTERVRLVDGSVHTKTVKSQRFSDGREESNESVEVNAPQNTAGQDPSSNNDSSNGGGGWFWTR